MILFAFTLTFPGSIDNSEWTRNGDYSPSRLEAAKEAVNYLASRKLADNVENCVGIMTMGGLQYKRDMKMVICLTKYSLFVVGNVYFH